MKKKSKDKKVKNTRANEEGMKREKKKDREGKKMMLEWAMLKKMWKKMWKARKRKLFLVRSERKSWETVFLDFRICLLCTIDSSSTILVLGAVHYFGSCTESRLRLD